QRAQQEKELVHANTMTDLAATELQEQEDFIAAQRAQQEKELVHANTMTDLEVTQIYKMEKLGSAQRAQQEEEPGGLSVFNSRNGVVEVDAGMSFPNTLQVICSSLSSVSLPGVLDVKIHQSLQTVIETLSTVNEDLLNQNPMYVLESVDPQWGHAIESGVPPEKIFPSDVLFYTLLTARNVLVPYVNNYSSICSSNGNSKSEEEETAACHENDDIILLALKVLRDIARGKSVGALSRLTREDVVQAIDVVQDTFRRSVIEPKESDVLVLNTSDSFNDSVTVCDHTKAEVAAACDVLSMALVQTVEAVGIEMLTLLRKRVHGGVTLRELALACCIVQEQLSSIVYTEPLHKLLPHHAARCAVEIMGSIIHVLGTTYKGEEHNEIEIKAETLNLLCSEGMKSALQILRTSVMDENASNVDLLAVYYCEEVREATVVLHRAVEAVQTESLRNSEDMNVNDNDNNEDDNSSSSGRRKGIITKRDLLRNKGKDNKCSKPRELQGDTHSVVKALRTYSVVLNDVYRDSEITASLYTPAVLSAVNLLLQVLYSAVDIHNTASENTPLLARNNMPLLQLLQNARTNTEVILQRVSLDSQEEQQQAEEEQHDQQQQEEQVEKDQEEQAAVEEEQEQQEEVNENMDMPTKDDTASPSIQTLTKTNVLTGVHYIKQKRSEFLAKKKRRVTPDIQLVDSINPKSKTCEVPLTAGNSPDHGEVHTPAVTEMLSRTPSTKPRSIEPVASAPNTPEEGQQQEEKVKETEQIVEKTIKMITSIRPIMKDASVMTCELEGSIFPNDNVKHQLETHDGVVQTDESAADLAVYTQFFLDTKAILGKEKEISDAAELLSIMTDMQQKIDFLQNVQEPTLKKKMEKQECELKTMYATVNKLQNLMQQYPSSSTAVGKEHKMPKMLRLEVRDRSLPLRRRKSSPRRLSSPVQYAEIPTPIPLSALGLKNTNTNTTGNITAVAIEGIVEEVIMWFNAWHTLHMNLVRHDADAINRAKRLEDLLSTANEERDAYSEKINTLNATLLKQQTEIAALRALLQTLHIDVDELNKALSQEHSAAAAAAAAAAQMRRTAGQTELCEMAATELRLRADELQSLRAEFPRLQVLRDAGLAARKSELLRRGLRGLSRSVQTITALLQRENRFNTGTLETQRLLLLDTVAALTAEIAEMQETLQQHVERRKMKSSIQNHINSNNNNNNNNINGIVVLKGESAVIASSRGMLSEEVK
ncbi:uncharacterized protein TM35_000123060, partial [Trypanosoma theileri]